MDYEFKAIECDRLEKENQLLKSTLQSDEEQLKSLVDRNATLRDAAIIQHQNDEEVIQSLQAKLNKAEGIIERIAALKCDDDRSEGDMWDKGFVSGFHWAQRIAREYSP
jgi:hypothetical protein